MDRGAASRDGMRLVLGPVRRMDCKSPIDSLIRFDGEPFAGNGGCDRRVFAVRPDSGNLQGGAVAAPCTVLLVAAHADRSAECAD